MKILFINDESAPIGGAELLTLTLRDGMRARGHDARVFAADLPHSSGVSFADYTFRGQQGRLQALSRTANLSAYRQLGRAIEDFRPDVVHVRMFLTQVSPLALPVLRDVPSVYHVDYFESICPTGTKMLPDGSSCSQNPGAGCMATGCISPLQFVPLMLQRTLYRRWRDVFDAIVPASRRVKEMLAEDGIASDEVLPSCVRTTAMRPPLSEPPTVAVAARLVYPKGVDVLVKAMAIVRRTIPSARLVVAGDGPERGNLAKLAANLGIADAVQLLGYVKQDALEKAFAPAWVQVAPSRWIEPFGLVAAEALMRGTACIVTNTGGLAEIVDDGVTGLHVPPDNADALAGALLKILGDRELAEAMGQRGRSEALRRYSPEACVEQFENVYHRVIHAHRVRTSRRPGENETPTAPGRVIAPAIKKEALS